MAVLGDVLDPFVFHLIDFFVLPRSKYGSKNIGYSFCNFRSVELCMRFKQIVDNLEFGSTNSGKRVQVVPGPYTTCDAKVKERYNFYEARRYNRTSNTFWFVEGEDILRVCTLAAMLPQPANGKTSSKDHAQQSASKERASGHQHQLHAGNRTSSNANPNTNGSV
jgi:hypothetical protein